jgi:hypothetical protein
VLTNLLSLVGSETGLVRVGDSVIVGKLQNTYAVFGRIEPPGIEQRALGVAFAETITLNNPASPNFEARNGPAVTVYIGSSRRCLVTLSYEIQISNNVHRMGVQVSGASTVAAVEWRCLATGSIDDLEFQGTRTIVITAADVLNEGVNVFLTMHKTSTHLAMLPLVGEVQITVQPF